uniref:Uncharacterized protein n=1 Tax=Mycena chlorophos TaxID=658473 RepID=A0ABQ0LUY2_MYCCL|nr:predicted protein [Mycena chlorophos]
MPVQSDDFLETSSHVLNSNANTILEIIQGEVSAAVEARDAQIELQAREIDALRQQLGASDAELRAWKLAGHQRGMDNPAQFVQSVAGLELELEQEHKLHFECQEKVKHLERINENQQQLLECIVCICCGARIVPLKR